MATDATQIVVAQMARVFLAPVGTTAPVDAVAAIASPWRDVGLFTPDSLGFNTDPSFEEVQSHQSNFPTRRFQTGDAATVEVDLQQWSGANIIAVFGGGAITEVTPASVPPTYKFLPPSIGGRSSVAAILQVIDGTKEYRQVIPRCEQSEGATLSLQRTAESTLPLRLRVLGSDVTSPWYFLSTDPAWDPSP
jgi:hypothetical protein